MGRKSEFAEVKRRAREIEAQLAEIAANSRKANDPLTRPLRLELRLAQTKIAFMRADRRQSKFLFRQAQYKLDLARADAAEATAAAGPNSEPLPFPVATETTVAPG